MLYEVITHNQKKAHPDREDLFSAVDIRQLAEGQQRYRGCQQIRGGDPAEQDRIGLEFFADHRHRNIDRREHKRRDKRRNNFV